MISAFGLAVLLRMVWFGHKPSDSFLLKIQGKGVVDKLPSSVTAKFGWVSTETIELIVQ